MRSVGGASIIEIGIEDVLAVLPPWLAVIDDESEHNIAGARFPIENVFAPSRAPVSITADPRTRITSVSSAMTKSAARLVSTMISGAFAHAGGKRQCLNW